MVELLGMVLDFLDALSGAVAIAYWWCTWISPSRQEPRLRTKPQPSEGPEIDRFLVEVRRCAERRRDTAAAGDLLAPTADADAEVVAARRPGWADLDAPAAAVGGLEREADGDACSRQRPVT